jgi:hypothetical protein
MNYYEARQTKTKTGWHFTCMNDGAIWPVGYCRDHDPHPTREEAEDCFARYVHDDISERSHNWTDCEVEGCERPANKSIAFRQPLGHSYALCDEHRTPEVALALDGDYRNAKITASY